MSNKFSHTNKTMKPPHICKKPPPGPEYIPPPLTAQPVQGYVEYFDAGTPPEGGFISQIHLLPTGVPRTWFGTAAAGDFRIYLRMLANAEQTFLSFEFDWYIYDILQFRIEVVDHRPRSWAPFDSGVVTPMPQPAAGRNHWRLWF